MITIDLNDEYIAENEKQAAQRQADRPATMRRILSSILRLVAGFEEEGAHRTGAWDCALGEAHAAMQFWSRG